MTSDLILETPFLTQIYPFYVNEIGLHTKIMEKTISFNFLTAAKQKEIAHLQSSSIYKQINTIQMKQNLLNSLQEEVSYLRIEEQLQNPNVQKKILDLEQIIKNKFVRIYQMLSGKESNIFLLYLMKKISMKSVDLGVLSSSSRINVFNFSKYSHFKFPSGICPIKSSENSF